MSDYGLRVYNASGYIQIDDMYANCTMIQSGTATTGGTVSVPQGLTKSMIFVRIPYGKTIALYGTRSNTSFTTKARAFGAADFSYEYKIFRIASTLTPTTGYGLQVFDSGGGLSFDSGYSYARIQSQTTMLVSGIESVVTIPSIGERPWIYLDPLVIMASEPVGPNLAYLYALAATQNSNDTVTISPTYVQPVPVMQNFVLPGTRTFLLAK